MPWPNIIVVKFETFRITFERVPKSSRKNRVRKKFESSFNARESLNVGITVAYLFNIVNELQTTDLYFHKCSSLCRMPVVALLRVYIIFAFWTLWTLFYFI